MNGMKLWWSIDAAITRVTKYGLFISIASIAYILIIAVVDIITTKFFNRPIPSTAEFIEDLHVVVVFMGMAYIQLERGHITGRVFEERFSKAINKAMTLAGYVIAILVCGLVSWGAIVLMQDMIAIKETKKAMIDFPLWPFALSTSVGFALLVIAYVLSIVRVAVRRETNSTVKDITQI